MRLTCCCLLFLIFGCFPFGHSQESPARTPIPLTLREAIQKNLLQQMAIQISLENINVQKGIAQSSAAPFDPLVNGDARYTSSNDLLNFGSNQVINNGTAAQTFTCAALHTDFNANETVVHFDVSKLTRGGTRFLLNLDIDNNDNPLFCPRRFTTGKITFEVDQPLLRGREYGLERMTELANLQEIEAVRNDTFQYISGQVLSTTFAYWNVVSARKNVRAQRESEERLKDLVEKIKYLIENQQLPGNDLLQPLAQLSTQVVSRIAAEQAYYDALQQLKFVMGEWNENCPCEDKRFEALEDFPFPEINPEAFPEIFCGLFPQIYHQRFDILASVAREQVYAMLLKGAKNLELPRLDVLGRVSVADGQGGANSLVSDTGCVSFIDKENPQKDFTVGIVFSTPLYRDEARGLIRQRQAQWLQAVENTKLLKQQSLNEISKALKNHISLQAEVKKAREAVDEYYELLHNETKKLIAGYSSIFILLNFETYLVNAIVELIQLQAAAAKNTATLRYLTGTLIRFSATRDAQSFVVEDPEQLPF